MIKQSTYDIIHGNNSVKKEKEGEDMNLLYKSTRNSEKKVTASEAILKGLAEDGGLFPENAKELIDDLVEKGELTVAQGRMLNEELKHTAKEKVKEHISVTVTRNYTDAMNSVDQMTEEELNALKEKIAQTEEARKEQPEDPDITSDERTPEESE